MTSKSRIAVYGMICASISLVSCDSSTGSGGSTSGKGNTTNNSRFGVTDSVLGRWKGIPGTSSALDTFSVTKDSLVGVWSVTSGTVGQSITPYSDAKFYAHGGRMGTTNGMTVSDNVTFEYVFSGDTLFVELQNLARTPIDGMIDRSAAGAFFTHGWLRR